MCLRSLVDRPKHTSSGHSVRDQATKPAPQSVLGASYFSSKILDRWFTIAVDRQQQRRYTDKSPLENWLCSHPETLQTQHQHLPSNKLTMNRTPRNRRGPVSLTPHMALMTYSIFAIATSYSLVRHKRNWRRTLYDIVAWSICVVLLRLREPREVWAFCLAIGYTTWNILPGSFSSLDLPSHSTFMRGLRTQDEQAECPICWDQLHLVRLPCRHETCMQCLQLMGENCQTTCPLCRLPLFAVMDWLLLAAMMSAVMSWSIVIPICLLDALYEFSHGQYRNGAISMACFYIFSFILSLVVRRMIIPRKQTWWRLVPGQWRIGHVCSTLLSSVWSVGIILWMHEGKYR